MISDAKYLFIFFSFFQANELLRGKPDGTFLIRQSSSGQYALSIVHSSGTVDHCLIDK